MMLYPELSVGGTMQFMGWLASLTLDDEVRQELILPRVVCESGLPPYRDVDFIIEFHLDTSPISMTLHRMVSSKL